MIPIGICTGFENLPEAHALGYDFVEIPLCGLAALSEPDFQELADYIEGMDIHATACYSMLPENLPIVGPGVSARALHEYLSAAFARAARLGVRVVSMDAVKFQEAGETDDFPMVWRQIGNFLRLAQGHASSAGLSIAVEPRRRSDSHVLNLLSEATLMAALLQLDNVGVLANLGSMAMASEPLGMLRRALPLLKHVHIEGALRRSMPAPGDGEDYERPLRLLAALNYPGGVSIRAAQTADFSAEAAAALERIRAALRPL